MDRRFGCRLAEQVESFDAVGNRPPDPGDDVLQVFEHQDIARSQPVGAETPLRQRLEQNPFDNLADATRADRHCFRLMFDGIDRPGHGVDDFRQAVE